MPRATPETTMRETCIFQAIRGREIERRALAALDVAGGRA